VRCVAPTNAIAAPLLPAAAATAAACRTYNTKQHSRARERRRLCKAGRKCLPPAAAQLAERRVHCLARTAAIAVYGAAREQHRASAVCAHAY